MIASPLPLRPVTYVSRQTPSTGPSIDPGEVRLTGENSVIELWGDDDARPTTRASHWRVLLSPAGAGHALFLESELTDGRVRVFADNVALARWLQEEIESQLHRANADASLEVTEAAFDCIGEVRRDVVERVIAPGEVVTLRWYAFLEPFVQMPRTFASAGLLRRYGTFIPAQSAQVLVNGLGASGAPRQAPREGYPCTTACLGWAETWVRPRRAGTDTEEG